MSKGRKVYITKSEIWTIYKFINGLEGVVAQPDDENSEDYKQDVKDLKHLKNIFNKYYGK